MINPQNERTDNPLRMALLPENRIQLKQILRGSQGVCQEEFPHFAKDMSHKPQISLNIFEFSNGNLLSLHSQAHAVTQSGFAGGEFLPLPRSKGAAFPCLLILEGSPPLPQRRSETVGSLKNGETPGFSGSFP